MDFNLYTEQNDPLGAYLCKYEDVCTTAARYISYPESTTNKNMTDYVSLKPLVQRNPNPSVVFSLIYSDGLSTFYGLKRTNSFILMSI